MTRKQRAEHSNETWDLSSTRGSMALRAAILGEEEGGGGTTRTESSRNGRRARAAASASDRRVPFQLREDLAASAAGGASGSGPQTGVGGGAGTTTGGPRVGGGAELRPRLADQLGPSASADPALIRDVLSGCGGDERAALQALRAMLGIEEAPPPQAAPTRHRPVASIGAAGGWGALHPSLPLDVQDLVLQRLPVRDLARCACAGRALRLAALREMLRARTVAAPAGCRPAELRGMAAALAGAASADLSRALPAGAVPAGALHAQMAREQQVALLLRGLAEGAALRLARAAAAAAAPQGGGGAGVGPLSPPAAAVPLSRLVFARGAAEGLTDYVLREGVLGVPADDRGPPLPHVRELAAVRAPLTSAALIAISKHRVAAPMPPSEQQQQQQQQQQRQAPGRHGGGGGDGEEEEAPFSDPQQPPAPSAEATATTTATTGFESIALVECAAVRDDGVRALLANAPCRGSLLRLDVGGCPALTSACLRGLHAPGVALRSLRAANLPALAGDLALLLPRDHPLQELDLAGAPRLSSLLINAPQLRELRLRGCRRLASVSGRFPALEHLVAGDCPSLSGFTGGPPAAVAAAAVGNGGGGGRPGTPPPFFAPALREAELRGCASLGDAAAHALLLSDGLGRAPRLERLDLASAALLTALELPGELAPRLERLDVSGCRALRRLAVGGGAFRSLSAGGCRALRSLTLLAPQPPGGLERLLLSNCAELEAVAVGRRAGDGGGLGAWAAAAADKRGGEGEEDEGEGAAGGRRGRRRRALGGEVNLDGTAKLAPADEQALRALVVVGGGAVV